MFELEEHPQLNRASGPQRLKPALERAPRGPARRESRGAGHANGFRGARRYFEGRDAENEGVCSSAPRPKGTDAAASVSAKFWLPQKSQRSGRCPQLRDSMWRGARSRPGDTRGVLTPPPAPQTPSSQAGGSTKTLVVLGVLGALPPAGVSSLGHSTCGCWYLGQEPPFPGCSNARGAPNSCGCPKARQVPATQAGDLNSHLDSSSQPQVGAFTSGVCLHPMGTSTFDRLRGPPILGVPHLRCIPAQM